MIAILTDEDLKRDDLKIVPISHIDLSDFNYFHDPKGLLIGQARTILFVRAGLIKVFKHFFDFPNEVVGLSNLTSYVN